MHLQYILMKEFHWNEHKKLKQDLKKLHEGLYAWRKKFFQESIATGYIESADGWKLKLNLILSWFREEL
jgi:hypothetical protein